MSHLAGMAGGCAPLFARSLDTARTSSMGGGVHVELQRGAIGWTDDGTLQGD